MPIISETHAEFEERNGVVVPDDKVPCPGRPGELLLPSGAVIRYGQGRAWGMAQYLEAPDREEEPASWLLAQLRYKRARVAREVKRLQSLKGQLARQAQLAATCPASCPPPPAESIEALKAGRERLAAMRADLATTEAEAADLPGARGRAAAYAAALQRDEEARVAGERLLAEIQGVNLQGGPQP